MKLNAQPACNTCSWPRHALSSTASTRDRSNLQGVWARPGKPYRQCRSSTVGGCCLLWRAHPQQDTYLQRPKCFWLLVQAFPLISASFLSKFSTKAIFTAIVNVCHQLWTLKINLCACKPTSTSFGPYRVKGSLIIFSTRKNAVKHTKEKLDLVVGILFRTDVLKFCNEQPGSRRGLTL